MHRYMSRLIAPYRHIAIFLIAPISHPAVRPKSKVGLTIDAAVVIDRTGVRRLRVIAVTTG